MNGYPGQPRSELGPPGKLIECDIRADVSVLNDIFCFIIIVKDAAGYPKQQLIVAAHQHLIGRCVTCPYSFHDLLV
jgi:hypothetical protein